MFQPVARQRLVDECFVELADVNGRALELFLLQLAKRLGEEFQQDRPRRKFFQVVGRADHLQRPSAVCFAEVLPEIVLDLRLVERQHEPDFDVSGRIQTRAILVDEKGALGCDVREIVRAAGDEQKRAFARGVADCACPTERSEAIQGAVRRDEG